MADAGFFKGTSAEQDRRFADKEKEIIKKTKFPANFEQKVDMRKVNLVVIQPWITKKIVELCGFEDDILINYTIELLEAENNPDPKHIQVNLTSFLATDAAKFMEQLWTLLLEAQNEVTGVPRTFVEQKKEEMRRARENDGRVLDERDRRARLDEIVDSGRGRGRGRGGWGNRGGFDDRGRGSGRGRDSGWGARGRGGGPATSRRSPTPPRPRYRDRSPPRRRRSPSRDNDIHSSRSPPPARRRRSSTPNSNRSSRPPSRSPPPNRRRQRSPSRSPPRRDTRNGYGRRDSRSPPRKRRPISRDRRSERSSRSRSPPPPRRRSVSPGRRNGKQRQSSRSLSRDRQRRRTPTPEAREGELKIKGQAEAERNVQNSTASVQHNPDLTRRENELKEKALRNKVMRSRKSS
ncbi:PWI domain-containing protein [Mycena chlorophos]|uniref:PWI domain-containing protein n=1 Tax=Mycena chlorophos TaxID=658473 RepID=A0A8H6SCU8_MYCCL|nr:PWI domain-containing protein [Mycena chlorophos]